MAGVSPVPVQMWQGEPSNWQPSPAVQNGMGWDGVGVGWGRGGVGWGGVDALSTRCADVAEKCGEVARLEQRRQVARKRKRVAARQRRRLDQRVEVDERQLWLVFEAAATVRARTRVSTRVRACVRVIVCSAADRSLSTAAHYSVSCRGDG